MAKSEHHPRNPLANHYLSAAGCDGTIGSFLRNRRQVFQYSPLREGAGVLLANLRKELLNLSVEVSDRKKLAAVIDALAHLDMACEKASRDLEEADKTCRTMESVIERCIEQTDAALIMEASKRVPEDEEI